MRVFTFAEPHPTGGDSVITITEDKIVEWMKINYPELLDFPEPPSDEDLISEFCALHWAWEIKP